MMMMMVMVMMMTRARDEGHMSFFGEAPRITITKSLDRG